VSDSSVSGANLIALDGKTTVAVNALSVGTLTGSAVDIATAISASTIDTSNSVLVTVDAITGLTSTDVTNLNLIDTNTTGVMTSTISGTSTILTGLTGTNNNYTITISDRVSIAALTAIDGITTGTVNYTSITDTAANLATLSGTTWTANSYITSGKNVFITGNIDPAELAAIDAANVNGTVTLLDLRLSAPTLILDLRSSAPTLTSSTYPNSTYPGIITNNTLAKITNNTVAKINDAPGDQTFEIEAGGNKLVLESVQGHNEIKFDGYLASELSVTYLGTTAIFTASLDPNRPQIASIAMSDLGPSQKITYRDDSHVELTLTGTTLALDGVIILNTGTIL
jgi:hypothetical protein